MSDVTGRVLIGVNRTCVLEVLSRWVPVRRVGLLLTAWSAIIRRVR